MDRVSEDSPLGKGLKRGGVNGARTRNLCRDRAAL
jgi:hypothetical protein